MTWIDTLEALTTGNSSVVLFCTATTGLHKTDKLLAMSYVQWDGDRKGKSGTIFLNAPAESLQPAYQYHHISAEMMHAEGKTVEDFRKEIADIMEERIGFTYNSAFQERAFMEMDGGILSGMPCPVCELSVWLKAAESRRYYVVDAPIEKAEQQIACGMSTPPWRRVLENRGLSAFPPPGMLPVTYNALCLSQLYEKLIASQLNIELALK